MTIKTLSLFTIIACGFVNPVIAQQPITIDALQKYCDLVDIKSHYGVGHAATDEKINAIIGTFCGPVSSTFAYRMKTPDHCKNAVTLAIMEDNKKVIDDTVCEKILNRLNQ